MYTCRGGSNEGEKIYEIANTMIWSTPQQVAMAKTMPGLLLTYEIITRFCWMNFYLFAIKSTSITRTMFKSKCSGQKHP